MKVGNDASECTSAACGDRGKREPRTSERASGIFLQSPGMGVDIRLLIKQIEARPALWNRDDKDYCQKHVVSKLWAEIALIHGVHESRVKSKWKALRDTFRLELKKSPRQSPWNYYFDMQFLKGQLKTLTSAHKPECANERREKGQLKTLTSTQKPECEGERGEKGQLKTLTFTHKPECEDEGGEITIVKTEPEDPNPYYQEECRSGRSDEPEADEQGCASMDVSQEGIRLEKTADVIDDDDDYHFLMSLLPEMRRLEPRQKLLLRIKMMELFYKEVYQ